MPTQVQTLSPAVLQKMKSNQNTEKLIKELKQLSTKEKTNVWKAIAKNLEKSTRRKRIVNVSKINKYTKPKETVIVPGKVLGTGTLQHEVTVAAFQFSDSAKEKIKNNLTIQELMKQNPKAKNIKILG